MQGLANRFGVFIASGLLMALGACSSSDSNKDTSPTPPPVETTGVLSVGVITGFVSVYVDGVRYDTNSAQVTMDGAAATPAQLRVGQYVEVKGHAHGDDHHADIIRYHNVLEGPITALDIGASSFVAMGQTVLVDAHLLRPLIDEELSIVFYDLTTIRTEGLSEQDGDVRHYGMSTDGVVARQFMLGVVQTADGLPIYHEVFDGNAAEVGTLEPTLRKVLSRYPHISRLVVVADRGLLSVDNIEQIAGLNAAGGKPLEFILAVPGRRYGEFVDLMQPLRARMDAAAGEIIDETRWQDHRLVVAHNPERAQQQTRLRRERITELQARAAQLAGKLDGQDAGEVHRGRKLSDSGAKARLFHEVCDARLASIVKVDLKTLTPSIFPTTSRSSWRMV